MLNTTGGKLSALAARAVHSAAMSRTRRSASHMGVCPAACGSIHDGAGISRRAMLPSGRRCSITSVRTGISRAARALTGTSSSPSGSSERTSSSPE